MGGNASMPLPQSQSVAVTTPCKIARAGNKSSLLSFCPAFHNMDGVLIPGPQNADGKVPETDSLHSFLTTLPIAARPRNRFWAVPYAFPGFLSQDGIIEITVKGGMAVRKKQPDKISIDATSDVIILKLSYFPSSGWS